MALARELHDGVANTITTVLVQAAAARAAGNGDPPLRGIESAARRAMEEIQATLGLMPREPLAAGGPLDDLPALLALAAEAGLEVDFTETGRRRAAGGADRGLPGHPGGHHQHPQVRPARHPLPGRAGLGRRRTGGRHRRLRLPARTTPPALPPTGGRGLAGLGDRMRSVGGVVESGTHKDGFRLAARLPVGVR